jgi:hypothetical protein
MEIRCSGERRDLASQGTVIVAASSARKSSVRATRRGYRAAVGGQAWRRGSIRSTSVDELLQPAKWRVTRRTNAERRIEVVSAGLVRFAGVGDRRSFRSAHAPSVQSTVTASELRSSVAVRSAEWTIVISPLLARMPGCDLAGEALIDDDGELDRMFKAAGNYTQWRKRRKDRFVLGRTWGPDRRIGLTVKDGTTGWTRPLAPLYHAPTPNMSAPRRRNMRCITEPSSTQAVTFKLVHDLKG